MGVFDKIGDAKSSEDSNPVRVGEIVAQITECKIITKYTGELMMLINMTVKEVLDGDHRPGEEITHFLKVASPSFLGNVKQFIASTLEVDPDQVSKKDAERVTSDENPLAGMVVRVGARMIKTREGKDFTKVFYKGPVKQAEGDEGGE